MKVRSLLLTLAGLGAGAVAMRRQLLSLLLDLPPVQYRVSVTRDIRLPMPDGVSLATDHYRPRSKGPLPSVLIRTPYGRGGAMGVNTVFVAQRFAERGYHVICQDVRGRGESAGEFEPYVHEAADGAATLAWIRQQPWSDGQVATWGQSYVGYVQWALAAGNGTPAGLAAMLPVITQSFLAREDGEPPHLDRTLRWLLVLDGQTDHRHLPLTERLRRLVRVADQDRALAPALDHLPLATADEALLGRPVPFFRTWQRHPDPADPYWQAIDYRDRAGAVAAPMHLIAGWYDIFLTGQLADYAAQRAAGRHPHLTVGPWVHLSPACFLASLQEGIRWFDAHLKGQRHRLRPAPVRVFVMGAGAWRELPDWPPPSRQTPFYLRADGRLAPEPAAAPEPPDRYRFDPADPTPHLGGPLLSSHAGPRDNRPLEARPDVLTYTSEPLTADLEIMGPIRLALYAASSRAHTDFLGRLCDVHPDGRSINICDGIQRLAAQAAGGDGAADPAVAPGPIEIAFSATAYRFRRGHRLRLQVASGAHPRFARHPGTGEPAWWATTLVAADQTVFHDASRLSALWLPVTAG